MDITLHTEGGTFWVRAVALFLHDGHVLLHQSDGEVVWNLPGGRVRVGESSSDAIRREMLEESGDRISVSGLQWVVELRCVLNGRPVHEIGFYHLTEFENLERYRLDQTFRGREGEDLGITYRWFPIAALGELEGLVPLFLYRELPLLPRPLQHVSETEVRT